MTSRITKISNSPRAEKIRFDEALKQAVERGLWPGTKLALGHSVWQAIGNVASEYPNVQSTSIQLANKAFADRRARVDHG